MLKKQLIDDLNQTLLNTIPFGVNIIDEKGQIMFSNAVFESVVGKNTIGKKCWTVYKDDKKQCTLCPFKKSIGIGETKSIEISGVLNGKSFQVSHTGMIYKNKKAIMEIFIDISEHKQYENKLRKLSLAIEGSPASVVITDKEGTIEYVNTKFTQVTGYTSNEVIRNNPRILKSGEQKKEFYEHMWNTLLSGKEWHGKFHNKKKNGEVYWEEASISPILNSKGEITNFVAVKEDITERKQTEEALKLSEERYSLAQYAANIGSWDWNILTGELSWSNTIEALFGFKKGEFKKTYEAFLECVHPDDRKYVVDSVNECIEKGKEYRIEHRIVWSDGSVHWLQETGDVIKDKSNKAIRMLGIVQDITERKEKDEEISKISRFPLENPSPILRISNDYTIIFSNQASEPILGHWKREVGEKVPNDFYKIVKEVLTSRKSKDIEFEIGSRVFSCILVPIKEGNHINYINFYGHDITERKKAEEAVRESEKKYHHLFENLNDAAFLADIKTGIIVDANKQAKVLLGRTREEIIGMSQIELHPLQKAGEYRKKFEAHIEKGHIADYDGEVVRKNGKVVPVNVSAAAITIGGKKLILGIFRDITEIKRIEEERKLAEEQIRNSLKEKEVLLKEIHHRVTNNLQIITSLLNLQSGYLKDENTLKVLRESQNRIRSMSLVHEELYRSKDVSRINFSEYIQKVVGNLFRSYGIDSSRIGLNIKSDSITLSIGKAITCGLIITELVSNSLKYAFPDSMKGSIGISLHSDGSGKLELVLKDDGVGLPKNFDWRNTTGSLGLQLVTTLTNQLDGTIELDRSNGTEFKITFSEQSGKSREAA